MLREETVDFRFWLKNLHIYAYTCKSVYTYTTQKLQYNHISERLYQIKYGWVILLMCLWNLPNLPKLVGRGLMYHSWSNCNVMPFCKSTSTKSLLKYCFRRLHSISTWSKYPIIKLSMVFLHGNVVLFLISFCLLDLKFHYLSSWDTRWAKTERNEKWTNWRKLTQHYLLHSSHSSIRKN